MYDVLDYFTIINNLFIKMNEDKSVNLFYSFSNYLFFCELIFL